jgi:DNA-directed RNA polymerase specialized sigma24 family protein
MSRGSALAADEPRLYSRPARVPVDVVEPQHEDIHAELEKWGRWNRERSRARGCASAESVYERTRTPGSTVEEVDLRSVAIEKAVLRMPEQQRDTTRLFYVQGVSPHGICRVFTLRYESFQGWMFTCRAMVLNLLRKQGV